MLGSKGDLTTSDPSPCFPICTRCSQNSYQQELLDKKQIRCSVTFFESRAVYEIMWRNIVEPPQMTVWCMLIPCWMPNATHTLRICNAYSFYTATMIARMHLNVTLYVHVCLVIVDHYS